MTIQYVTSLVNELPAGRQKTQILTAVRELATNHEKDIKVLVGQVNNLTKPGSRQGE